jgi:aspartate/glutamate/glutamine transport system substrate-binding protein
MKKKLFSVLVLSMFIFLYGCSKKDDNADTLTKILQRGKIIVGVKYDARPFGYINENNELVGYDIDLAKYTAKNLLGDEDKIEFKQVTPSSRIFALNSGQVDMVIATMTITQQRQEVIDFSNPYYMAGQAILVPKNSTINTMSDLNGKKVIIIFGTTSEKNLRLAAPEANIVGFKTYTGAYNALKEGDADAMTSDDTILIGLAMADDSLKLLPKRYTKEPYAIGFKKGDESKRLETRVNAIIKDMLDNGELNKLKAKWINGKRVNSK